MDPENGANHSFKETLRRLTIIFILGIILVDRTSGSKAAVDVARTVGEAGGTVAGIIVHATVNFADWLFNATGNTAGAVLDNYSYKEPKITTGNPNVPAVRNTLSVEPKRTSTPARVSPNKR